MSDVSVNMMRFVRNMCCWLYRLLSWLLSSR